VKFGEGAHQQANVLSLMVFFQLQDVQWNIRITDRQLWLVYPDASDPSIHLRL
jgi:hypothetical protein